MLTEVSLNFILFLHTLRGTPSKDTINLEDEVMRERITSLIYSTDDPFAVEI